LNILGLILFKTVAIFSHCVFAEDAKRLLLDSAQGAGNILFSLILKGM